MTSATRDWANMLEELVIKIAESIELYNDFIRFGVVCKRWRSVTNLANFKGHDMICWLMEGPKGPYTDDRVFTPTTAESSSSPAAATMQLHLPETNGRQYFETLGWLVTVNEGGDVNLLHPFSHANITLPHVTTFAYCRKQDSYCRLGYIERAVLSSSPSRTKDYVVMIIFVQGRLGFWRPGNPTWSHMTATGFRDSRYLDIVYYKDRFYAVDVKGQIVVCDVRGTEPNRLKLVGQVPGSHDRLFRSYYLVQCGEELLIVRQCAPSSTVSFIVFTIHNFSSLAKSTSNNDLIFSLVEKTSLGNYTLFLGHNASTVVDASQFHGVEGDCIYYTRDNEHQSYSFNPYCKKEVGIYHMEDWRRWMTLFKQEPYSKISQPIWITPCP